MAHQRVTQTQFQTVINAQYQLCKYIERSDNMYILETNDGDRWTYDENELENARRDKYIFGGEITHIEEE